MTSRDQNKKAYLKGRIIIHQKVRLIKENEINVRLLCQLSLFKNNFNTNTIYVSLVSRKIAENIIERKSRRKTYSFYLLFQIYFIYLTHQH